MGIGRNATVGVKVMQALSNELGGLPTSYFILCQHIEHGNFEKRLVCSVRLYKFLPKICANNAELALGMS